MYSIQNLMVPVSLRMVRMMMTTLPLLAAPMML